MSKRKISKKRRLEAAGWREGDARDFLGLTAEEEAWIETRRALTRLLAERRKAKRWTQVRLAQEIDSSQSRVAKMEAGDPSVSIDLLVRALYKIGVSRRRVAQAIASG